MKVLIVGCGDLGSRLARKLLAKGHEVMAVKRNVATLPEGVKGIAADVCDSESLSALKTLEIDYLVVATTAGGFTEERYQQVYVDGLSNVLSVVQPRHRLLLVSSSSVYGQSDSSWVDEDSETLPAGFSGRKQLEAEAIALQADCAATVVRFTGIYGPGRTRLIEQVYQGQHTAAEPLHYSNRIHADDCAGILEFLIEQDQQGVDLNPIYLCTDHEPSLLHDVKNWMAEQMQLTDHWVEMVKPTGRGGSKRCNGQRIRDLGYEFQYPDYRAGYAPVIADYLSAKQS